MSNSPQAPFCNVKGVVTQGTPTAVNMQPVPPATDLASALKAIQALTNNFNNLNTKVTNGFNSGFSTIKSPNNGNNPDWTEDRGARVVKTVKIQSDTDPSQFVTVQQIQGYTMKNKKTGETFKWQQ